MQLGSDAFEMRVVLGFLLLLWGADAKMRETTMTEIRIGDRSLVPSLAERKDRGESVKGMTDAVAVLLPSLDTENNIHGIISLGGGCGTAM